MHDMLFSFLNILIFFLKDRNMYLKQLYVIGDYMRSGWFDVQVTVPAGHLRLVLQVERGFDRYSTISLDDITLVDGRCSQKCTY